MGTRIVAPMKDSYYPQRTSSDKVRAVTPRRVLIVEDSSVIQHLVAVCLRPLGVEIEARDDGPSGLETALESPPDLIVLDIGLPGMSGWDVLAHLRSDERTRHVKVLVLTAHSQQEDRTRADQGGADSFMTKPFQPGTLRDAVSRLLVGATGRSIQPKERHELEPASHVQGELPPST